MSIIQHLHDSEIQGCVAWPIEGKILVYIGCPLQDRRDAEALVDSFAEGEAWLHAAALRLYPDGRYAARAMSEPPPSAGRPIVQELYERGIPGAVYWIYEDNFGVAIGHPAVTDAADRIDGVRSWAEAEAWLRRNAIHHLERVLAS